MSKNLALLIFVLLLLNSCHKNTTTTASVQLDQLTVESTMNKHLSAVSNKDLESLAETLPPDGQMQLILPATEIKTSVDEFIQFHQSWFSEPDWTFETNILNSEVGTKLAMVVVEIIYREPLRDGAPYFNRMIVSYVLEKSNGQWFVIKDHASSVEKSTDND